MNKSLAQRIINVSVTKQSISMKLTLFHIIIEILEKHHSVSSVNAQKLKKNIESNWNLYNNIFKINLVMTSNLFYPNLPFHDHHSDPSWTQLKPCPRASWIPISKIHNLHYLYFLSKIIQQSSKIILSFQPLLSLSNSPNHHLHFILSLI